MTTPRYGDFIELDRFTGRPASARIHDYLLGGASNFAPDRLVAKQMTNAMPSLPTLARAARSWLAHSVRFGLDQGVAGYADIGAGLPATVGSVQAIAEDHWPGRARVAVVERDLVAVAAWELAGKPNTRAVAGDLARPGEWWPVLEATGLIDPREPLALVFGLVLDHLPAPDASAALDWLTGRLVPGSLLIITHALPHAPVGERVAALYREATGERVYRRSWPEIVELVGQAWQAVAITGEDWPALSGLRGGTWRLERSRRMAARELLAAVSSLADEPAEGP